MGNRTSCFKREKRGGLLRVSRFSVDHKFKRYVHAIIPFFLASVALVALAGGLLWKPQPIKAQIDCDPIPITIVSTPQLGTGSYTVFQGGAVTLVNDGASVILTANGSWGTTNQYVGGYGFLGEVSAGYIDADLDTEKDYTLFLEVSNPSFSGDLNSLSDLADMPDEVLFEGGTFTQTVHGDSPGTYNRMFIRVDGGPPPTNILFGGTWKITIVESGCGLPEPPPPPPTDYCPDGIDLISGTATLIPAGGTWTGDTETEWNKLWVRYTFTEATTVGSVLHRLNMAVNEETVIRQFYTDQVLEYDIETNQYINDPWSYSVPNITDSEEDDYDPTAYAVGTSAYLTVTSGYNPLNLVSACVLPWYGPSELCQDGIEALSSGPVYLDALTGAWEATIPVTSTHVVVRYNVENPSLSELYPWLLGKFVAGIDYALYYVEAPVETNSSITFTLPTTGVVKLYDEELYLEFYNRNWPMQLNSVCVIDANENGYLEQLTAEECHLTNPDFVQNVSVGWNTDGSVTWSDLEENGVVYLETGQVNQTVQTTAGRVWTLEVRAKDYGGDTMDFGTPRTSLVTRGMQTDTVALAENYSLYSYDIFVIPGDYVFAQSAGAVVDSVCLLETGNIFGELECGDFPVWDPTGSGDPLYIYLFKYIGDIIEWGVCEVARAIGIAANAIFRVLQNILLAIPMTPDPGSGLISWIEWLGLLFSQQLDWLGISIPTFAEWFPVTVDGILRWVNDFWIEIIDWLANQLDMDPQDLLAILDAIYDEAMLFWNAILDELGREGDSLALLLQNMVNVLITLMSGVREGISGNEVAYIGSDFSGVGEYIWKGVDFLNDVLTETPLSALNLVSLGAITIGLALWTSKKFVGALDSLS